jgi:hypothetical protein
VPATLAQLDALCGAGGSGGGSGGFTSTGETAGELYLFSMLYQLAQARPGRYPPLVLLLLLCSTTAPTLRLRVI